MLLLFLICLSALFSGLTLGICGFDMLSLDIVVQSGSPKQQRYAKKILPVRQDGNLLLCTLLLGNVSVNAAVSILMADVAGGTVGFVVSTMTIVILGEIFPQAVCSRHPLPIGATAAPLVRFLMFVLYPIAKPVAMLLDLILGREIVTKYSKDEIIKLLDIQMNAHNVLNEMERRILAGTLKFRDKHVSQIMTKLERVNMISVTERLTFDVLYRLFQTGNSRIPVFDTDRTNVVGLIFVKDLILLNPEEATPVRTVMQSQGHGYHRVFDDVNLDVMMNNFKHWRAHMAIVEHIDSDGPTDPIPVVVGIVTLEDVLEELLNEELVDEFDTYVSNETHERPTRESHQQSLFYLFDKRIHSSPMLSDAEAAALQKFLENSQPDLFGPTKLNAGQVISLLVRANVTDVIVKEGAPKPLPVIQRGQRCDGMLLILQGTVDVISGSEAFVSRHGPLSVFATATLTRERYIPDFTIAPRGSIRYLTIRGDWYLAAANTAPVKIPTVAVYPKPPPKLPPKAAPATLLRLGEVSGKRSPVDEGSGEEEAEKRRGPKVKDRLKAKARTLVQALDNEAADPKLLGNGSDL